MLDIQNLTIKFGGLTAVNDVSLHMDKGRIYGLIGPNGAGKTTFFNIISGVYAPTSGTVAFEGRRIDSLQPYQINKAGIARTYQVINLFRKMTALDNILVGMHTQLHANFLASILHMKKERSEEEQSREEALKWLDFVGLRHKADCLAGDLPYGEQRLVEIGRALASKPKLVLLDEPAAGMNSGEKETLNVYIRRILKDLGISVLVIEHDMKLVMSITDYIYVLNFGKKLAEGTPEAVQKNPEVIAAYLGGE